MLPLAFAALVSAFAGSPSAAAPVQRFTLVIGANSGGADRPLLQYAISDAERFARVLVELGGVSPANEIVLKQPRLRELLDALDLLNKHVVDARRAAGGAGRTEILLYYSGHADEQGLLIGDDRYSYRTLRDRLDQIPADVRIAILDACASGAFTRLKGGRARPAFLVDESADMRGHAFLTSSAETEVAQESDRIHASYFTHYLISGFRGAADLSGDGRVTLNEAYQFAFNETLRRTVDTKGGAQHPSYDINLSGTGDVVMTDVRQTSATLVLGEDLEGRFFIRNAAHELVVELYKPRGRKVELGVEPGAYEVRIEQTKGSLLAKTQIADGGRVLLEPRQFGVTTVEAARPRGGAEPARFSVAGRHRIELQAGMWQTAQNNDTVNIGSGSTRPGHRPELHPLRQRRSRHHRGRADGGSGDGDLVGRLRIVHGNGLAAGGPGRRALESAARPGARRVPAASRREDRTGVRLQPGNLQWRHDAGRLVQPGDAFHACRHRVRLLSGPVVCHRGERRL